MFHRQKPQDEKSSDENTNNKNVEEAENEGREAPDVSIPPATRQSSHRRIGVRIAGDDQPRGDDVEKSGQNQGGQAFSLQNRPFTGFNRLQKDQVKQSADPQTVVDPDEETQSNTQIKDNQDEESEAMINQFHSEQNSYDQTTGYEDDQVTEGGAQTSLSTGRKLMVGNGISLTGEIEECHHLVVEGRVEAALKGAKVLDIQENGTFIGSVEIEEATIAGRFEGEITVNGRLTITQSGSITGTISYKELEIEAGATLEGKVSPISESSYKSGKSADSSKSEDASSGDATKETQKTKNGQQEKKSQAKSKSEGNELPLSEDA